MIKTLNKNMLNKLNKKQIVLMEKVRNEWLDRLFSCKNRTNKKESKKYINWLYKFCGLKEPMIIFLDSPLGIQFGANILKNVKQIDSDQVWDQVRNQVLDQVGDQVWDQVRDQVWDQVLDQVGDQVWDQVRDQVWDQVLDQVLDQVRNQVWDQVRNQVGDQVRDQVLDQVLDQVRNQVGDQVRNQVLDQVLDQVGDQVWETELEYFYEGDRGSIWDYEWVSFYDYFTRIKVINHQPFNKLVSLLKANIFGMLQLRSICFVSDMPTSIKRDNRNRLHSSDSPAIEWADGYKLYFLYGVAFDEKLWQKVVNKELSLKEILKLKNIEQRMVALKVIGPEKLLDEAKAKLIEKSEKGNELYLLEGIYNIPAYFLKYKDPSTDRVYVSAVPPEIGEKKSADLSMAWKFSLSLSEYLGIKAES